MDAIQCTSSTNVAEPFLWSRSEIASRLVDAMANAGDSQQECADQVGVPRTTLQNWRRNRDQLEQQAQLPDAVVQFFRVTPRARGPTQVSCCPSSGVWASS
jgi:transcriptional regulator with XRE-family HTH domain